MRQITIEQLGQVIGAELIGSAQGVVEGVGIDSRNIKKGEAFFAIKGQNYNGQDFIADAAKKGISCAVVNENIAALPALPILKVNNTITALNKTANYIRNLSAFKVIAITGSAGKTTTRNMIYEVLSKFFKCSQAKKSFNNNIGLPLTILGAKTDTEIIITELGSNHPGEIEELTKTAQPDIAVITNIYPAHLEGFGNIEAIIKEKVSIAVGLKTGGKLIINGQSADLKEYCNKQKLPITIFGKSNDCDVFAENITTAAFDSVFTIDEAVVNLPLAGVANVENAVAAFAACKTFGINAEQFAKAIKTIRPANMRLTPIKLGKTIILNDCYNANPASMENALETLVSIAEFKNARPVFICGKMAELGKESEKYHTLLGKKVAQLNIPLLLTVKGTAEQIAIAAKQQADSNIHTEVFDNVDKLCDNLDGFLKSDDIILIKASRSERFEKVVVKVKKLFHT